MRRLGLLALGMVLAGVYVLGRRYFGDLFAVYFAVSLPVLIGVLWAISRRSERVLAERLKGQPLEQQEHVLAELDPTQRERVRSRMGS